MLKPIEEIHSELSKKFKGNLFRPEDPNFDEASRIWNGMVARRPGLIARCADVIRCSSRRARGRRGGNSSQQFDAAGTAWPASAPAIKDW